MTSGVVCRQLSTNYPKGLFFSQRSLFFHIWGQTTPEVIRPQRSFVRLLPIMSLPGALSDLHIREHCRKARVLRAAGINAKAYLPDAFPHMTNSHLRKMLAILRTLNAVIIFPAAEPIPHSLHVGRNCRRRPI